ncbi:hypothetical protein T4C_11047 [Trichinella pseudospiralis]|uniref:Uncharacterized protein n=1 Tax=Trichinella pseudospiralis TaxID=6337 RepID=A0A0V1JNL4_TRIPS|nr:hypothetical protein T4C_11047 [Trichinella pseudospiralis]
MLKSFTLQFGGCIASFIGDTVVENSATAAWDRRTLDNADIHPSGLVPRIVRCVSAPTVHRCAVDDKFQIAVRCWVCNRLQLLNKTPVHWLRTWGNALCSATMRPKTE